MSTAGQDEDLKVFQSETERLLQVIFERTAGEALGTLEWAIDRHRQQEATLEEELGQMDRESHVLRQSYDKIQKRRWVVWKRSVTDIKETNFRANRNGNELCEAGLIQKG